MDEVPAFAVVVEAVQFCPDTDAVMGTAKRVVSRHLTYAEAEAAAIAYGSDEESWTSVELKRWTKDEDKFPIRYSLLELHYDKLASMENYREA